MEAAARADAKSNRLGQANRARDQRVVLHTNAQTGEGPIQEFPRGMVVQPLEARILSKLIFKRWHKAG